MTANIPVLPLAGGDLGARLCVGLLALADALAQAVARAPPQPPRGARARRPRPAHAGRYRHHPRRPAATPSRRRSGKTRPRCCASARMNGACTVRALPAQQPRCVETGFHRPRDRPSGAPDGLNATLRKRPIPLVGRPIRVPRSSPLRSGSQAPAGPSGGRILLCRISARRCCKCASMPPGRSVRQCKPSGAHAVSFHSRSARCCAVLAATGPAQAQTGYDRRGGDYLSFQIRNGDPAVCAARCERDARCRAWSFSYPRTANALATCWLKNQVPPRVEDNCCVSGVRGAGVIEPRRGGIEYSASTASAATIAISRLPPDAGGRALQGRLRGRQPLPRLDLCAARLYRRVRALLSQGQDQARRGTSRAAFRAWCDSASALNAPR